jgi:hypothetical protein
MGFSVLEIRFTCAEDCGSAKSCSARGPRQPQLHLQAIGATPYTVCAHAIQFTPWRLAWHEKRQQFGTVH